MFEKLRAWFDQAWKWISALWEKHDDAMQEMVSAILPMVVEVTFRHDLSGEQKRKAIVDAVLDSAELEADRISTSMLNEAIEIAANKYNIQIGKLTSEKIDNAKDAALEASRKFLNGELKLTGKEAEEAGVKLTPPSAEENQSAPTPSEN